MGELSSSAVSAADVVDSEDFIGMDWRCFFAGRASPPESVAAGRLPLFVTVGVWAVVTGTGVGVGE